MGDQNSLGVLGLLDSVRDRFFFSETWIGVQILGLLRLQKLLFLSVFSHQSCAQIASHSINFNFLGVVYCKCVCVCVLSVCMLSVCVLSVCVLICPITCPYDFQAVLGSGAVGKSALTIRLVTDNFLVRPFAVAATQHCLP